MVPLAIAGLVFAGLVVAALLGTAINARHAARHLDGDTRDVIKLVMGLVATMAALVLSLLIASANTAFTTQNAEMEEMATNLVQADRLLANYGPDAEPARVALKAAVEQGMARFAPGAQAQVTMPSVPVRDTWSELVFERLETLSPHNDAQAFAHRHAFDLLEKVVELRRLMAQQARGGVSRPFMLGLVFWLAALFFGFGLFARFNVAVVAALSVGALSVSIAIFLILELNSPYAGLVRLPAEPLRAALGQLNQ